MKTLIEKLLKLIDKAEHLNWTVKKMNLDRENLVNLEQWKNSKKESKFSDYLKVLSFNDLINESDSLMNQLKRSEKSEDLFSKSRVMINEFALRLEKESKNLAESVKDLKKTIEDKLH